MLKQVINLLIAFFIRIMLLAIRHRYSTGELAKIYGMVERGAALLW